MITDTYPNYIFIRICISLLQFIAPLSIGYIISLTIRKIYSGANSLYFFKLTWLQTALFVYALLEAGFYLGVYLPRKRRMQAPPVNPPPTLSRKQRERIFDQCFASVTVLSGSSMTEFHETTGSTVSSINEQDPPYPLGWFLPHSKGVYPSREKLTEWLLWALFSSSHSSEVIELHKEELETYVRRIEENRLHFAHMNVRVQEETLGFQQGTAVLATTEVASSTSYLNSAPTEACSSTSNSTHRSMRVTLDTVEMLHRPLLWYFIVCIVDTFTTISLLLMGFKHYTPPSLKGKYDNRSFPPRPLLSTWLFSNEGQKGAMMPYWYKPHTCRGKKMPLLFLHGIGIGLFPYLPFFRTLFSHTDSMTGLGMVIPELLPICMHMTQYTVPCKASMLESLDIILEHAKELDSRQRVLDNTKDDRSPLLAQQTRSYGGASVEEEGSTTSPWDKVVLCAHSYGTFVAGWIVRKCVDGVEDEQDVVDGFLGPFARNCDTSPAFTPNESPIGSKIARIIMVDPIPILLSNPAVAKNFLYRHPSTVTPRVVPTSTATHRPVGPSRISSIISKFIPNLNFGSASAWQLFFFASRDADVARTLFRAFFWAEGGIWTEEVEAYVRGCSADEVHALKENPQDQRDETDVIVPKSRGRKLAVVLGGQDQIVPAHAIRRYLTGETKERARWSQTFGDSLKQDARPGGELREENEVVGSSLESQRGRDTGGVLDVLFNPVLDHAVIFDEKKYILPLVDLVSRYIHD